MICLQLFVLRPDISQLYQKRDVVMLPKDAALIAYPRCRRVCRLVCPTSIPIMPPIAPNCPHRHLFNICLLCWYNTMKQLPNRRVGHRAGGVCGVRPGRRPAAASKSNTEGAKSYRGLGINPPISAHCHSLGGMEWPKCRERVRASNLCMRCGSIRFSRGGLVASRPC
jgi:hypothetical protein